MATIKNNSSSNNKQTHYLKIATHTHTQTNNQQKQKILTKNNATDRS